MALVAYEGSDSDSITDEESEEPSGNVEIVTKSLPASSAVNTLFTQLPEPKKSTEKLIAIQEENDEFLLKREVPTEKPNVRKPVRITAPSLKDLDSDDEDEPKEKRPRVISKSSGLFSILPPPKAASFIKTTKSFVPNAVKNKMKTAMVPTQVAKEPTIVPSIPSKKADNNNTDDEDDIPVDDFDVNIWKKVCGRKTKVTAEPIVEVVDRTEVVPEVLNMAPEPAQPYEGLDNEAFKKLVGSSKIRRENIKLIDVNEEEVLTGEDILRSKALTDPEVEAQPTEEESVSAMSKRKHHITYLAQQAKANEQELKSRWAANKYTRKQTQAKYGF